MTQEDFLRLYDVKHVWNYTTDEKRCHIGAAPSIGDCVREYGRENVRFIVRQHLDLFIDFVKAANKPDRRQRDTLVWFCLTQFAGLKITEFQLFIIKAMSGYFGKFYNTLDPLDITCALRAWTKECEAVKNENLARLAREQAEQERNEWQNAAASPEEVAATMEAIMSRLKVKR